MYINEEYSTKVINDDDDDDDERCIRNFVRKMIFEHVKKKKQN